MADRAALPSRRPPRPVDIATVIRRLQRTRSAWNPTALAQFADAGDPFRVLIACILSLRTQDTTTGPATYRSFRTLLSLRAA